MLHGTFIANQLPPRIRRNQLRHVIIWLVYSRRLQFDDMMHYRFFAVLSGTGVYIHVQITKFNLLCFSYVLHLCWLLHLRMALMLYIGVYVFVTHILICYSYRIMITRRWQVVYPTGS